MIRQVQLEVTTRCQYDCWYCTGRAMKQQDMAWYLYVEILNTVDPKTCILWLQGEGEPTVWPFFEKGAAYAHERGFNLYSILNGTQLDPVLIPKMFGRIGVSLDTLDVEVADWIGRYNLPKVLRNLELLAGSMSPDRITIHTVNLGQDLQPLNKLVAQHGFGHAVQDLQKKNDYVRVYPGIRGKRIVVDNTRVPCDCQHLKDRDFDFYTVDGTLLPCCYIKNPEGWPGSDQARSLMNRGRPVSWCDGCHKKQPIRGHQHSSGDSGTEK